jgi:hypothetical protein
MRERAAIEPGEDLHAVAGRNLLNRAQENVIVLKHAQRNVGTNQNT